MSAIWSSNSTTESVNATAKLHDTGNLVLMDQNEKVLWQSFDYPTQHWLPGMKIGNDYSRGIEWHLSSWKISQHPLVGEFTWGAENHGYPDFKLKQGSVVKMRGDAWRNQQIKGISSFSRNWTFTYKVIIHEKEVSFSYNHDNSSTLFRITLSSSGKLESWGWVEGAKNLQPGQSLPKDLCDTYNICGAYGSCVTNMFDQSCACLDETKFVPRNKKGWEMADWSDGCVRRTPLYYTHSSWFNKSMNMQECEAQCLANCTCMAYTNPDASLGGRGCLLWFGELIDIRVYPEVKSGRDIFVRIAASNESGVISKRQEEAMELPLFTFSRIANATANFSPDNKLGEGGFGPVYKGVLEQGHHVAVKRLSRNSSQGLDEFRNEVICISKLQHRNLVKLLGCCIQGDEKLLIYEYMPNKSLDAFIFDKAQGMFLDWTRRFNIIKGIARGLVYLHQDSRFRIIHRDLKASNILLDQDMNPKISDFGIARSFGGNESRGNTEIVVGTYGYMSPEYALDGIFSMKSDVFSFGVLVLEIVSGKRNRRFTQQENNNNLMGYTWNLYNEGRSMELVDATFAESCHPQEVLRSIQVGLLCVQQNAGDRPNMSSVIMMLSGEHSFPQPKQPAYFMEGDLFAANFSASTKPTGSINELTITEVDAR
uniref:non-specific serine/threonine protein kinase n=2 Tax=Helianthus annuus TaxID=4232 RepID=A0A251SGZ7_HELAN